MTPKKGTPSTIMVIPTNSTPVWLDALYDSYRREVPQWAIFYDCDTGYYDPFKGDGTGDGMYFAYELGGE